MLEVFDVGTAQLGSIMFGRENGGSFGVTKTLTVAFKRPGPLKKALRLIVRATDVSRVNMGQMDAAATLSDGDSIIAEMSCELVDPARRQRWKSQQQKTAGSKSRL